MKKITGTFIQPLCGGDVPVMDWRFPEWDEEFALMKRIGIDTVILLRQMLGPFAAYDSPWLKKLHPEMWEVSFDYLAMLLRLCEKHRMHFYVPTYNPGHDWLLDSYDPHREFEFLVPLVDELMEKCGNSPAFAGWYFAHEISRKAAWRVAELFRELGPYCKKISGGKPVLMSPGIQGPKVMKALLEAMDGYGLYLHRVTQTQGIMRLTDEEIAKMVELARQWETDLILAIGPRATTDTSASVHTEEGVRMGYRLRGQEQIVRAIEDVKRADRIGCRGFLAPAQTATHLLRLLSQQGHKHLSNNSARKC